MRAAIALTLVAALLLAGCSLPTPAQNRTLEPRSGRVLDCADGGRLALVYSYRSQINLLGFERLHPGDIHRQGRIFNALVGAGVVTADDVFVPEPATDEQLLAVHGKAYLKSLRRSGNVARVLEAPAIGLMLDSVCRATVVRAFRVATGGTVLAGTLATEHGLAIHLGGGFQHAFRDHGEGFGMFADVPLAIHTLRASGLAKRALIVDCDIHQCNGFASYYLDDPDTAILDIFERDNYPHPKQPQSHPLPIERGISEADYLDLLARELPAVLDAFRPDVLFYVAGTDAMEGDRLGHARVSADGLVARDLFVIRQARQRGIPTAVVLAGGYHPDSWRITFRAIHTLLTGQDPAPRPAAR